VSTVLLVRLKIPDLTALTALDAGRALLPRGYELSRLVREEVVLFEPAARAGGVPGNNPGGLDAAIANAVETSNFFVNPNKEGYRLLGSAERGESWVPPEGSWGILTRSREDTRDAGLLERLQREHPLAGLQAIRRGRVWWLWTRGPAGDAGVEASLEALGPVEHAGRGLLVNPHSESWLVVSGPTPWVRIEAFLEEPSPEKVSAPAAR
jgi:hypothetical protein